MTPAMEKEMEYTDVPEGAELSGPISAMTPTMERLRAAEENLFCDFFSRGLSCNCARCEIKKAARAFITEAEAERGVSPKLREYVAEGLHERTQAKIDEAHAANNERLRVIGEAFNVLAVVIPCEDLEVLLHQARAAPPPPAGRLDRESVATRIANFAGKLMLSVNMTAQDRYERALKEADAIMALALQAGGVGTGWRLVPIEPTKVMVAQGQWVQFDPSAPTPPVQACVDAALRAEGIWHAMIQAAPPPPNTQEPEG